MTGRHRGDRRSLRDALRNTLARARRAWARSESGWPPRMDAWTR